MRKNFYALSLILVVLTACDKQSKLENVNVSNNNVTRAAKKAFNRLDEMICRESDLKCLAEEAKHRTEEGIDYIDDKTKELANKID